MKILFFQFMRKKLNVASDEFVEKYRRYRLKMFLSEKDKREVEKFINKCKKEYESV
ncbi:MAG: hypothetical protein RSD79_06660 [Cetobacterium sp.]